MGVLRVKVPSTGGLPVYEVAAIRRIKVRGWGVGFEKSENGFNFGFTTCGNDWYFPHQEKGSNFLMLFGGSDRFFKKVRNLLSILLCIRDWDSKDYVLF